jgi:hypothetical protein
MTAAIVSGTPTESTPRTAGGGDVQSGNATFYGLPEDSEIVLGSLQHDQYVVKVGIKVSLSVSNGKAFVEWREAALSATGNTLADALERFRNLVLAEAATNDSRVVREHIEARP